MVVPDDAAGWKAELGCELDEPETDEVVILCPDCWEGEFADG